MIEQRCEVIEKYSIELLDIQKTTPSGFAAGCRRDVIALAYLY